MSSRASSSSKSGSFLTPLCHSRSYSGSHLPPFLLWSRCAKVYTFSLVPGLRRASMSPGLKYWKPREGSSLVWHCLSSFPTCQEHLLPCSCSEDPSPVPAGGSRARSFNLQTKNTYSLSPSPSPPVFPSPFPSPPPPPSSNLRGHALFEPLKYAP